MSIDRSKLPYAASFCWALLTAPMANELGREIGYGIINMLFALCLLNLPSWAAFGWRWLSNKSPFPLKLIAISLAIACIGALLDDDWASFLIPLLFGGLVGMALLHDSTLWPRIKEKVLPSRDVQLPSKSEEQSLDIARKAQELISHTNIMTQQLTEHLTRHYSPPPLAHIFPVKIDALQVAYSLVYLHTLQNAKTRTDTAVFAVYKSAMITNIGKVVFNHLGDFMGKEYGLPKSETPLPAEARKGLSPPTPQTSGFFSWVGSFCC